MTQDVKRLSKAERDALRDYFKCMPRTGDMHRLLDTADALEAENARLKAELAKWKKGHEAVVSVGQSRLDTMSADVARLRGLLWEIRDAAAGRGFYSDCGFYDWLSKNLRRIDAELAATAKDGT